MLYHRIPAALLLLLLSSSSSRSILVTSMAVPSSLCRSGATARTTTTPTFSKRTFAHNAKHNDDDDDTAADNDDDDEDGGTVTTMDEEETRRRRRKKKRAARQFTIFTCGASACASQRQRLGLDEFATFASMYVRANAERGVVVPVMETRSCLGACQYGPCVAVGHDEYEGMVALTGMDSAEFTQRVFFRITSWRRPKKQKMRTVTTRARKDQKNIPSTTTMSWIGMCNRCYCK
jgi:hypothetical protein